MKRAIIAFALAMMAALTLCACGSGLANSKYCGTWEGETASYEGVDLTADQAFSDGFTITLDKTGTATINADGTEATGTWEESDTGVSIDDGDVELTADGDKLVVNMSGVTITLVKADS